mmetsp:Transcript_25939/g.29946  ORF Transcript_25939/g.29946 Transcript_25939/m.29946 type:complete len:95 (+) Transcript_25939:343-627(+)
MRSKVGRTCVETALCQNSPNIKHFVQAFVHKRSCLKVSHEMLAVEWAVVQILRRYKMKDTQIQRVIWYLVDTQDVVRKAYQPLLQDWLSQNPLK